MTAPVMKTRLFMGVLVLVGCTPDTGTEGPGWPGVVGFAARTTRR